MPCRTALLLLCALTVPAHAVIVRGKVTTAFGVPLPGSRVQLIRLTGGARNAADTIAGIDGSYELRTDLSGRFLLLTSPSINAPQFAPQLGYAFYGGRTDLLTFDIALDASAITPQVSAQPTLIPTPLAQLSDPPSQTPADQLLPQATVLPELRPLPSAFVVQSGQTGAPATLYLRGAPITKALIDGVSAEPLGSPFNPATLTSSGLAANVSSPSIELTPGANPLDAVDAQSGVLTFATPLAAALHPTLLYSGDAGTLSTIRNEAVASVATSRADALGSFARFNTDNDIPAIRIHLITETANLGYRISANTGLRLTLRNDLSAGPLPSPFAFYLVAPATKLAEQNLIGAVTFETRTSRDWHNQLRYGLARERSQAFNFSTPAQGLPVTIAAANGYTASGIASFPPIPAREDTVTNRDEYSYQTDYPFTRFLAAVLTLRYQDERAADLTPTQSDRLARGHFTAAISFQGNIRHRLFFDASGFLDHATVLGIHGSPHLGLTYAPVRPGTRKFRGTSLHATAATGVREPSVVETAQLPNLTAPRSRTFDVSVDQTILPKKLTLRATYFHDQLSHQTETLSFSPLTLSSALAYRTQGLEAVLRLRPAPRLAIDGGYTYLAALVERSAAAPVFNPNIPAIPIGAVTALTGARPFERPPNTGFFTAHYTASVFTASLKAAFAGRSDDSTALTLNPKLLLPNRNLSPGYASLDANFTYNVTHAVTLFTQLTNLLDNRHIAPLGYDSTPFLIRAGLRIRIGRE
jgi:iron complex outermembrane receptor protein/vitamin B12 transporter